MKTKLFSCNPAEVRVFGEHLSPDDDSVHPTEGLTRMRKKSFFDVVHNDLANYNLWQRLRRDRTSHPIRSRPPAKGIEGGLPMIHPEMFINQLFLEPFGVQIRIAWVQ